jgi:hypothetical protein
MSKNTTNKRATEEELRQSRKEVLLARKQAQQTRQIRIAMAVVAALIGVVILMALILEFFIIPNRTVATVGDETIPLASFEDRVVYERARRVVILNDQLDAFQGNVGIIQQFASDLLVSLLPTNAEAFGEGILNEMVDELLIQQAAAERGIVVSDEDVQAEIGRNFNFFDGGLPTPLPTATETVVPTPSLTPISTAVITEVVPTATIFPTPTTDPASIPPTATPVSAESFQEQFAELIAQYRDLGTSEAAFRTNIQAQLLRQSLADALATEQELPREAEHASFYLLAFNTEEEAALAESAVLADGFLPEWNRIRSQLPEDGGDSTAVASEILWRTQEDLAVNFDPSVAEIIFNTELNTPSGVISVTGQDGIERYLIVMVSGREQQPLSEAAYEQQKQALLTDFLTSLREEQVTLTDFWRSRVPSRPSPDPIFYAEPTPTPVAPAIDATPVPGDS